jgi:C4-dicarboxylate transporter DctM subunit
MTIAAATLVFLAIMAIGTPIFIALGAVSIGSLLLDGKSIAGIAQHIVDHLNSETLMAVPFFVIAARFMQGGGIAKALIDLATSLVGPIRGGLGLACILATAIFAAICGSSVATAMAMGGVLAPAMVQRGYERGFVAGLLATAGTLGILIPPSLSMIVYAVIAEESVPRLFLAGVVPGLLQAAMLGAWVLYQARRRGFPREPFRGLPAVARAGLRGIPALLVPVLVLGGIYGGVVTVSEAAAVAAVLAIAIGYAVYRGFTLRESPAMMGASMRDTAAVFMIVVTALLIGFWITTTGLPQRLADMTESSGLSAWQFLLFINVVMLLLGTVLEGLSIILITVPILLPILTALDIDKVHFAVVLTINIELALLSPPIGLNLFVLAKIIGMPVHEVERGVLPFIGLMLILLAVVTYVPGLSLWLPNLVLGAR